MGTQNLFVIFPPGLGGNHLANLISLNEPWAPRCTIQQYGNVVADAHFAGTSNLQVDSLLENVNSLSKQNNVFCGHAAEYIWFTERLDVKNLFPNRKYVIVNFPRNNQLAFARLQQHSLLFQKHDYILGELATLYRSKSLELLYGESDWFYADSDLLFSPDVSEILTQLSSQGINISMSKDIAQDLHSKWLSGISKNQEKFK